MRLRSSDRWAPSILRAFIGAHAGMAQGAEMNAPCPVPQPDKAAILDTLAALFDPADVIELRAFPKREEAHGRRLF
jgi:hypothetical protein